MNQGGQSLLSTMSVGCLVSFMQNTAPIRIKMKTTDGDFRMTILKDIVRFKLFKCVIYRQL